MRYPSQSRTPSKCLYKRKVYSAMKYEIPKNYVHSKVTAFFATLHITFIFSYDVASNFHPIIILEA